MRPSLASSGARDPVQGCHVTKSAPHKTLKSIAGGKLTFDERVVLHRLEGSGFGFDKSGHTPKGVSVEPLTAVFRTLRQLSANFVKIAKTYQTPERDSG
jgi:hypothetical protein